MAFMCKRCKKVVEPFGYMKIALCRFNQNERSLDMCKTCRNMCKPSVTPVFIKKKQVSFVLPSFFRNFATIFTALFAQCSFRKYNYL